MKLGHFDPHVRLAWTSKPFFAHPHVALLDASFIDPWYQALAFGVALGVLFSLCIVVLVEATAGQEAHGTDSQHRKDDEVGAEVIETPLTPDPKYLPPFSAKPPLRQKVLDSLLELADVDLRWVLEELRKSNKGRSLDDTVRLSNSPPSGSPRPTQPTRCFDMRNRSLSPSALGEASKRGAQMTSPKYFGLRKKSTTPEETQVPRIMMGTPCSYLEENDGQQDIPVLRVGNLQMRSEVWYQTVDGTAIAGEHYEENHGKIVFEPNEHIKYVTVQVIDDDVSRPSSDFAVKLLKEGLVNCDVSPLHCSCKVKIMDDDVFPTNYYAKEIKDSDFESIPYFGLMMQYLQFNLQNPSIYHKVVQYILLKLMHAVFFLSMLLLNVYMVDYVLNPASSENQLLLVHTRSQSLVLVGIVTVVLFGLKHLCDSIALALGISRLSKQMLHQRLVDRFLNLTEENLIQCRGESIQITLLEDAGTVVEDGLMQMLLFADIPVQFFMLVVFQFVASYAFAKPLNSMMCLAMVLLPGMLFALLAVQMDSMKKVVEQVTLSEEGATASINKLLEIYPLVKDFAKESWIVRQFMTVMDQRVRTSANMGRTIQLNDYATLWLVTIATAVYFFVGGAQVLHKEITLGMFLANLSAFSSLGHVCGMMYKAVEKIAFVTPAMERITVLMNRNVDLPQHKYMLEEAHKKDAKLLSEMKQPNIDKLPILANDLNITYYMKAEGSSNLRFPGHLEIHQGTLNCIIGKRSEGKSSLLRLLARAILPAIGEGPVHIPSHLRLLHVQDEPTFLHGTLLENLTFGVEPEQLAPDGGRKFCMELCLRLGLSQASLNALYSEEKLAWKHVLSKTDAYLINLVRAFVNDPEVLCIHKPTQFFDEIATRRLLEVLREFVTMGGFSEDKAERARHRPRTCIMTSNKILGANMCDHVFKVSAAEGIRAVTPQEVQSESFLV